MLQLFQPYVGHLPSTVMEVMMVVMWIYSWLQMLQKILQTIDNFLGDSGYTYRLFWPDKKSLLDFFPKLTWAQWA